MDSHLDIFLEQFYSQLTTFVERLNENGSEEGRIIHNFTRTLDATPQTEFKTTEPLTDILVRCFVCGFLEFIIFNNQRFIITTVTSDFKVDSKSALYF